MFGNDVDFFSDARIYSGVMISHNDVELNYQQEFQEFYNFGLCSQRCKFLLCIKV